MTISLKRTAAIAALAALPAFGALALAPAGMAESRGAGDTTSADTTSGGPFGGSGPGGSYTGYDVFGRNVNDQLPPSAGDEPDLFNSSPGRDPGELPPLDLASLRDILASMPR